MGIEGRISLLKLAEYMDAPVELRSKIAGAALSKNDAAAVRYSRARSEVIRILRLDRARHGVELTDAVERFRQRPKSGDFDESDLTYSAEALDLLRDRIGDLDLGNRPPRHKRKWPLLSIEGVGISVAPDVIVRELADPTLVGGVKVRFSSGRALTAASGQYAATILRYYLLTHLRDPSQRVAPRLCQVVDAFSGQIFVAKKAYKQEMGRVRKACLELRAQWRSGLFDAEKERSWTPTAPVPH